MFITINFINGTVVGTVDMAEQQHPLLLAQLVYSYCDLDTSERMNEAFVGTAYRPDYSRFAEMTFDAHAVNHFDVHECYHAVRKACVPSDTSIAKAVIPKMVNVEYLLLKNLYHLNYLIPERRYGTVFVHHDPKVDLYASRISLPARVDRLVVFLDRFALSSCEMLDLPSFVERTERFVTDSRYLSEFVKNDAFIESYHTLQFTSRLREFHPIAMLQDVTDLPQGSVINASIAVVHGALMEEIDENYSHPAVRCLVIHGFEFGALERLFNVLNVNTETYVLNVVFPNLEEIVFVTREINGHFPTGLRKFQLRVSVALHESPCTTFLGTTIPLPVDAVVRCFESANIAVRWTGSMGGDLDANLYRIAADLLSVYFPSE